MKFRNIQPRNIKITEDKFKEGQLYVCVATNENPQFNEWVGAFSYIEGGVRYALKGDVVYESLGKFFGNKDYFFKPDNHTKHFKGVKVYTTTVFEKNWV